MKIFNGTPHTLNIIEGSTYDPTMRKYVGGKVVRQIPSNRPMSLHVVSEQTGNIDGILVFTKKVLGMNWLPYGYDIYIVSLVFARAHGQTPENNIYVPTDIVVTPDGRTILGCRGIQLYKEMKYDEQ